MINQEGAAAHGPLKPYCQSRGPSARPSDVTRTIYVIKQKIETLGEWRIINTEGDVNSKFPMWPMREHKIGTLSFYDVHFVDFGFK